MLFSFSLARMQTKADVAPVDHPPSQSVVLSPQPIRPCLHHPLLSAVLSNQLIRLLRPLHLPSLITTSTTLSMQPEPSLLPPTRFPYQLPRKSRRVFCIASSALGKEESSSCPSTPVYAWMPKYLSTRSNCLSPVRKRAQCTFTLILITMILKGHILHSQSSLPPTSPPAIQSSVEMGPPLPSLPLPAATYPNRLPHLPRKQHQAPFSRKPHPLSNGD